MESGKALYNHGYINDIVHRSLVSAKDGTQARNPQRVFVHYILSKKTHQLALTLATLTLALPGNLPKVNALKEVNGLHSHYGQCQQNYIVRTVYIGFYSLC